jgi:lysophospholipase L1-like esterase
VNAHRLGRRLALLAAGVVLPLAAGEFVIRLLRLDGFASPVLRDPAGRHLAKLSELERFIVGEGGPRGTSITQFLPGTDARGWYDRPEWSYFDDDGCVTYRIDSLGFRDHEFPLERAAGDLRVLALGDSFTFGLGVQVEDCWVERLERSLAAATGRATEVVNGGVAIGLIPPRYAEGAARLVPLLDPDALIIGLCLNDVSGDIPLYLMPFEPPVAPLGGVSRLLVVANQARVVWTAKKAPPPRPIKAKRFIASHAAEWEALTKSLAVMRDLCAERRMRFVVVIFPMMSQLASGYPFAEIHAAVAEWCTGAGIENVDCLPPFLGRNERSLWVHPTDQHMNDVGHALLAGRLADWFAAHPIEPRPR